MPMSGPMSSDDTEKTFDVVAVARRRWSKVEKRAIVEESLQSDESVSAVAKRHGISASLLFRWRKDAQVSKEGSSNGFLPVTVNGSTQCAGTNVIEIELANGHRVRVGSSVEGDSLKRVLDILSAK